MFRKFQQGGNVLPAFTDYTPVITSNAKATAAPAAETSGSSEDITDKDLLKMLEKLDGLPNDMNALTRQLQNFYIEQQYGVLPNTSSIASRYLNALNLMKQANFNKKEYENAYNQVKDNGGINEIAVDEHGLVICVGDNGQFKRVDASVYTKLIKQNPKIKALTNLELLQLRAQHPELTYKNEVLGVVQNGIGMKTVNQLINEAVKQLGSNELRREGYTQTEQAQIKQGLEYLQRAQDLADDQNLQDATTVEGLYNVGVLTKDLARQAAMSLSYVYSTLPKNARALLEIKAAEAGYQGNEDGAKVLISNLINSRTSLINKEDISRSGNKGKTSTSGDKSDDDILSKINLNPVLMMQAGMTDRQPITLNMGTKYQLNVNAQILPITTRSGDLLGANANMEEVSKSAFGHVLDMNNVTMGGQELDPNALGQIVVDSTNLYVMNLPIDTSSTNGVIKPNLRYLKTIEAIDQQIREKGITDIAQINKLYTDAGLPVLMDDAGNLNVQNYCKFGVLNGRASGKAFGENLDPLDLDAREIEDENAIKNYVDAINKGRDKDSKISWESGWFDPFGSNDTLYEGSIYIPIRTNSLSGAMSSGVTLSPEQAAIMTGREQLKERLAAQGGYHAVTDLSL